jgi:hypothetical protein
MALTDRRWWLTPILGVATTASRVRTAGFWTVLVFALGVFSLGIGVPDAWGDESASWLAVTRPWRGIPVLLTAGDAPLVPYYVLVKLVLTAVPLPPLLVMRAMSALAAAVAVGALYSLVVRRAGLLPALTASVMMLALPGLSRYAQEARPYALLVMTSTLAWLAWDTWVRPGRARTGAGEFRRPGSVLGAVAYVGTLAGSVVFHLFGGLNWPAQLLADATTPKLSAGQRLRRILTTAGAMVVAILLVLVPVGWALRNGTGPHHAKVLSDAEVWRTYIHSITVAIDPVPAIPVLVLTAVGLSAVVLRWRAWRRFADLARVAAIWLLVPLGLAMGLGVVKHQLMSSRYWTQSLAPLALLAGIGLVVLAELGYRAAQWGLRSVARQSRHRWGVVVAVVVLAVGLGSVIAAGIPQQVKVRSVGGHAMEISAAYARIEPQLAADPTLKVIIAPRLATAAALARYPDLRPRDIYDQVNQHSALPWPEPRRWAAVRADLKAAHRIVWLRQRGYADHPHSLHIAAALARSGFQLTGLEVVGSFTVMIWQR